MGNFEKLVVLAVLFLSAIVLAVSLNDEGQEVEAGDPITAARDRVSQDGENRERAVAEPAALPRETATPATQSAPDFLLNRMTPPSAAERAAPAVEETFEPRPPAQPAGPPRILRVTSGLKTTADPDHKVYTVVAGDTWEALARRFYGDGSYVTNLHRANEEQTTLVVGDAILVPVYDFIQEAGRPALEPADRLPAVSPSTVAGEKPAASEAGPRVAPAIGEVYVVQSGDSLSKIAQLAYGNGHQWRPIFEANRDKMRTPDWLQVGMRLTIPDPARAAAPKPDPNKPRVR